MRSADLVAELRSIATYHAGPLGPEVRAEWKAADRIEALEAWKAETMEVLRRHRGNTVPVMKALMATGSRGDLILADDVHRADDAARRLVEKEDGRHG